MAKRFMVTMPFAGFVVLIVEAEDESGAIDAALNAPVIMGFEPAPGQDDNPIEHYEWDMHKHIVQGNVLYASQNNVEVKQID